MFQPPSPPLDNDNVIGSKQCLCLPKAELKTKNSTKRQLCCRLVEFLVFNSIHQKISVPTDGRNRVVVHLPEIFFIKQVVHLHYNSLFTVGPRNVGLYGRFTRSQATVRQHVASLFALLECFGLLRLVMEDCVQPARSRSWFRSQGPNITWVGVFSGGVASSTL